jgi:hypothetical protein
VVQATYWDHWSAFDGELSDDATALCFDWHGGAQGERIAHAGAEHRTQRERH